MTYEERKVSYADVYGVTVHRELDGKTRVSGIVRLNLEALDGSDNGPNVVVELATLSDSDDPTIRGAERDLITAAVRLLGRFASEDPANLFEILTAGRDDQDPNPFAPKD